MTKIAALAGLSSLQTDDVLPIVDVHDTTMAPSGTTKKITVAALQAALLQKVADTGPSGFALQNGTPAILSWTAPADGKLHSVTLNALLVVATNATGGQVNCTLTIGGQPYSVLIFPGGQASGVKGMGNVISDFVCDPGTTVSFSQASALTGGAATLYGQLWGA